VIYVEIEYIWGSYHIQKSPGTLIWKKVGRSKKRAEIDNTREADKVIED